MRMMHGSIDGSVQLGVGNSMLGMKLQNWTDSRYRITTSSLC